MGEQSLAAAAGDQIPTDSGGKVDSPNCKSEIRICHQRDLRKRLRERKRDLDLRERVYILLSFSFLFQGLFYSEEYIYTPKNEKMNKNSHNAYKYTLFQTHVRVNEE